MNLGYIALMGLCGFAKAKLLDLQRSPHIHSVGLPELLEEAQYRFGIERLGLRDTLGLSPTAARTIQAILFGLDHPGNELDAALGGVLYSKAYDAGGMPTAVLAHLAHNIFVHLGGRP